MCYFRTPIPLYRVFSFIGYTEIMDTEKVAMEKMVKSLLDTFISIPDPRGKKVNAIPYPRY
jgi:hypothetical protein